MKKYKIQKSPFVVPTDDGKLIEEHWGEFYPKSKYFYCAHDCTSGLERASPNSEFDEFTIVISGKKQFEIDGEIVVLEKGQSILIEKGARIRYSNPVLRTLRVYCNLSSCIFNGISKQRTVNFLNMALQICPKCKEKAFIWFINEKTNITNWSCFNCDYEAKENEVD